MKVSDRTIIFLLVVSVEACPAEVDGDAGGPVEVELAIAGLEVLSTKTVVVSAVVAWVERQVMRGGNQLCCIPQFRILRRPIARKNPNLREHMHEPQIYRQSLCRDIRNRQGYIRIWEHSLRHKPTSVRVKNNAGCTAHPGYPVCARVIPASSKRRIIPISAPVAPVSVSSENFSRCSK